MQIQIQMRERNLGDPEFLLVLHHVSQYGTSNEDLPKRMFIILILMMMMMMRMMMMILINMNNSDGDITMSFLRGGSSIRILNLASRSVSPCK